MKKLGYVLTKSLKIKDKVDYIEYVNDISLVEEGKPLLVIGLSEARKVASDKFSILNKQFGENMFWTFGRTEKREEYEVDLTQFYDHVLTVYINKIKYIYINLLNIKYSVVKRLYSLFNSSEKKYIYIWNDMVYVLCKDNTIIGFSLRLFRYVRHDVDKVVSKIISNESNVVRFNIDFINKRIKRYINGKSFIIPYIMSIMEE